jgi:Rad3-related DNA helicase
VINSEGKDILDFWCSNFEPRKNQVKALRFLEQSDKKFNVVEAPVGSGKSIVGMTYARWLNNGLGNAFILTPQIVLQEQYMKEKIKSPMSIATLKGAANYACKDFGSCDVGKKVNLVSDKDGNMKPGPCEKCPFTAAFARSKTVPLLVMNNAYAGAMLGFIKGIYEPRELIIFDEAHNLEQTLIGFGEVMITALQAEKHGLRLPATANVKGAFEWVTGPFFNAALDRFTELTQQLMRSNNIKIQKKLSKEVDVADRMVRRIDKFVNDNEQDYAEKFILIKDKMKLIFKPIFAKELLPQVFGYHAGQYLFMSSTISKEVLVEDFGIPENEIGYISLASEFDVDRRTVAYMPATKMNYGWDKPENKYKRDLMLEKIKMVLDMHTEHNGLIHTGSFAISKWLVDELEFNKTHVIHHHNTDDNGEGVKRGDAIDNFLISDKPSVLISPSITEGLDLKDGLGRFSIIAKLNFPSLADKWVKTRQELNQQWYARNASIGLIQGSGRVVRSPTDWGMTYILDESFETMLKYNRHLFPQWWLDSLVTL